MTSNNGFLGRGRGLCEGGRGCRKRWKKKYFKKAGFLRTPGLWLRNCMLLHNIQQKMLQEFSHNQILTFKKLIGRVHLSEPSTKEKLEREKLNVKSLLWFQYMKEAWRVQVSAVGSLQTEQTLVWTNGNNSQTKPHIRVLWLKRHNQSRRKLQFCEPAFNEMGHCTLLPCITWIQVWSHPLKMNYKEPFHFERWKVLGGKKVNICMWINNSQGVLNLILWPVISNDKIWKKVSAVRLQRGPQTHNHNPTDFTSIC